MCEAIQVNGSTVFLCRGKKRHPEKMCRFCRQRSTTLLCDFEVGKGKRGSDGEIIAGTKTCDAEMCAACATQIGDDLHLCPDHAAAVKQATLVGETDNVNRSAAESHARAVLAGSAGPWKLTDVQRALLRILLFHQGAQRAITLRDLMGKLSRVLREVPNERELKDAARGLVVDFKVRIGASRNTHPGYYLIGSAEEARDTARPYIEEIKKLAARVKVLLDPHDLAELQGQRIFAEESTQQPALSNQPEKTA